MKEILIWIVRLFIVAPWWLKLVALGIVLGIISAIFSVIGAIISMPFEMISKKSKEKENKKAISQIYGLINCDCESAFQLVIGKYESKVIDYIQYIDCLRKIAYETGHFGAVLRLIEIYSGENSDKNSDEYMIWLERAAKAGHLMSIKRFFGFSDYDVHSNAYDDMFQSLNNVSIITEEEKNIVFYLRGIILYKIGNIDMAKQIFEEITLSNYAYQKNYMLFQCALQKNDMEYAEKMLEELEHSGFQVSANDYLNLYNYCVSKRNSLEHSYEKEIRYVEKYATSKHSEAVIVDRIGGDSYYNFAVAMQNKSDNMETNEEEIFNAYKKAADYGNPEALYYIGRSYWIGLKSRDYYQAIQFLGKAAKKNHEQAKQILDEYGFEGIIVRTMQNEKSEYQFLNGHILSMSNKTLQWFHMFYGIKYQGIYLSTVFRKNYMDIFKTFNQMINGVHQLYADYIVYMLQWCIRLLMSYNIDTYSAEDIIERCEDLSLFSRVPIFEQKLEKLDNRAKELNAQMYYAKLTRGVWCGSGFGTTLSSTIKATVQASVAAEAMNIGSGLLHGIGDSIVKSTNNAELTKMGEQIFASPDTLKEFEQALISACVEVAGVVMNIMSEHGDMEFETLGGTIMWKNELLENIDDRSLKAKIDNNLAVGNYEYAYALLLEFLRREPVNLDVLQKILELTIQSESEDADIAYKSCIRYAGDFNLKLNEL